jgi:hypothetical protein
MFWQKELGSQSVQRPAAKLVTGQYFSPVSRPVLGPIQPPMQWVLGGSYAGGKTATARS